MGVDVVSVGLRHRIRVNKPLTLIEDVSNIYNANIRVVYYNANRNHNDWIVMLMNLKKENAVEDLTIELPECQILNQKTSPNVSSFNIDLDSEVLTKQLWDAMCNSYGHYDISGFKDFENRKIRVFRETVDIGINVPFRWYGFIENFNLSPEYHYPDDASILQDYRRKLYIQTLLLGCDEVIYFPDQYQGELIYLQIDKLVNDLLCYINNKDYYKEMDKAIKTAKSIGAHQFSRYDINWAVDKEFNSIFIDIPDFILNKRECIDDNISIDVLFDDFRDLNEH